MSVCLQLLPLFLLILCLQWPYEYMEYGLKLHLSLISLRLYVFLLIAFQK